MAGGVKPSRSDIHIDYGAMRAALIDTITTQFPAVDLLRVYWYDGPGHHGKTPHHSSIEQVDDFKLRLGTRNGAGDQKAVDGLIIADMIALAQNRSITDALLVSGDADLTPGVAAAQSLGIRVHLLSMGSGAATSPYLEAEVDRRAHWGDASIHSFARRAIRPAPPAVNTSALPAPQPIPADCQTALPADSTQSATACIKPAGLTVEQAKAIAEPIKLALSDADRNQLTALAPSIPAHIDVVLLRAGAQAIGGRKLQEAEKRRLRAAFNAA